MSVDVVVPLVTTVDVGGIVVIVYEAILVPAGKAGGFHETVAPVPVAPVVIESEAETIVDSDDPPGNPPSSQPAEEEPAEQ